MDIILAYIVHFFSPENLFGRQVSTETAASSYCRVMACWTALLSSFQSWISDTRPARNQGGGCSSVRVATYGTSVAT